MMSSSTYKAVLLVLLASIPTSIGVSTYYYQEQLTQLRNQISTLNNRSTGPLTVYVDFKSFNFTQGSQTSPNPAFCMPSNTPIVFWVKVSNAATDSSVTLKAQTMMQMQPYSANGLGAFVRIWIDDPGTVNPTNVVGYNETTNPYMLPAASPNGSSPPVILKFSATSQGSAIAGSSGSPDNWITFIGFYYIYRGQAMGQTIPLTDFKTVNNYPVDC